MDKSYIPKNWDCQIKLCSLLMLMMEMDLRFARSDSTCRRLLYSSGSFDCSSSNYHVIPFNCSQDFYLMFRLITYPSLDSFHFSWAQFHNQGFTLIIYPYNFWPNFKWFAVLFWQIQLMSMYMLRYTVYSAFNMHDHFVWSKYNSAWIPLDKT